MRDESTLGGYQDKHDRPPAFEGIDGRSYSVSVMISDEPDPGGYGAALLFVRWTPSGSEPDGHVETDYLTHGETPQIAEERICELPLLNVKQWLDDSIARRPESGDN